VSIPPLLTISVGFFVAIILALMLSMLKRERLRQDLDRRAVTAASRTMMPVIVDREANDEKLEHIYATAHRARRNAERRQGWLNRELDRMLEEK
jgi:hypothetical protein